MGSRVCLSIWSVCHAINATTSPFSTIPGTDGGTEEKDLVIIGGGVAGYVAAIKAGQEGMKVTQSCTVCIYYGERELTGHP